MSEKRPSMLLRTPIFRMSYPNLITSKRYKDRENATPTFGTTMILDADDMGKFIDLSGEEEKEVNIAEVMGEICRRTWPDITSVRDAVGSGLLNWPIKDGNAEKAKLEARGKKGDAYEGKKLLTISMNHLPDKGMHGPKLYVTDAGKLRRLDRDNPADMSIASDRFVGGSYARAVINLKGTDGKDRWPKCYVNVVSFVKQGERFGRSDESLLGGVDGGAEDYDPTAGMSADMGHDDLPA